MKSTAVLEKNNSGLTASTIDDSVERMRASGSFGSEIFCTSLREDQLTAAESRRSHGNFFLRRNFSKITRESTLGETGAALAHKPGVGAASLGALPQQDGASLKSPTNIETVFSQESSESEVSDSDDKLHKAFNIDPVLTMIPRVRRRDFSGSGVSPNELILVEEELRKKYQKLQISEKKKLNANKKRSLRAESQVWNHAEEERATGGSLGTERERELSRDEHQPGAEIRSFYSPGLPRRVKSSLTETEVSFSRHSPAFHSLSLPFSQTVSTENKIDLDRIAEVGKTALYIKNIPNKYTKKMLLKLFDRDFRQAYDFFYLPIDFNNNCNIGFAFIKFTEVKYVRKFCEKYGNKKWPHFNSEKICEIRYARMQKAEEMLEHFKNSSLWRKADASCLPFISSTPKPHLV